MSGFTGNSSADLLTGDGAANVLTGNAGADTLVGNGGADTLIGGTGNDSLVGGAGADRFVYDALDFGQDVIGDFRVGQDRIDLSGLGVGDLETLAPFIGGTGLAFTLTLARGSTVHRITVSVEGGVLPETAFIFSATTSGRTLSGAVGGDALAGGRGADTITGASGSDVISAGAGADLLIGGTDNDRLIGGPGRDIFRLDGLQYGNDLIVDFTPGEDRLDVAALGVGDLETLRIFMTDTPDGVLLNTPVGTSQPDRVLLSGVQLSDLQTRDFVFETARTGQDRQATVLSDAIIGGRGADTIQTSYGADTLAGGAGNDVLIGDAPTSENGNDLFFTGLGADRVVLNRRSIGADTIADFMIGEDRIDVSAIGIADFDTLRPFLRQTAQGAQLGWYAGLSEFNTLLLPGVSAVDLSPASFVFRIATTGQAFSGNYALEAMFGGLGADTLDGNGGADTLLGGSGNDVLEGEDGNDSLIGGPGLDTAFFRGNRSAYTVTTLADGTVRVQHNITLGSDGIDMLSGVEALRFADQTVVLSTGPAGGAAPVSGNASSESLVGTGADELITGGAGDDTLEGGAGADTIDGGTGYDVASYATSPDAVLVSLTTGTALMADALGDVLIAIESLLGSAFNDTLIGSDDHNIFEGGAGRDSIEGRGGNDWLSHEHATSGIFISLAKDPTVGPNLGNGFGGDALGDTVTGIENLRGSAFADGLYGDAGANILRGDAGPDTLYGDANSDTIFYSTSPLPVFVDLSTNSATGGHADGDVLVSVENVFATAFNDRLIGDSASNTLVGWFGADTLTGNGSNDIFRWDSIFDSGVAAGSRDIVTDFFRAHGDLLDVSGIDANSGVAGDQAFTFIGTAAFSAAGQLRFFNDGLGNTVFEVNVDGNLAADMAVQLNLTALIATDFVL